MSKVFLGDVAKERKDTYKGSKSAYSIVGLEHLIPEEITLTNWDEGKDNTFSKLFCEGDILFGRRRAYLKKAAVAPFNGICSGDITVIQAIPEKILPDLLPFIIQNDYFFDFAIEKSAGSLSPRVKWEFLKSYEFELPCIDTQRKLSKVLWAIYETKKSYKNLLQRTDDLLKSQFFEMVENNNCPKVQIGDIFNVSSGGTPARSKEEFWINGKIPWVKISDMYVKKLILTDEHITEQGLKGSSTRLYKKGTFLFSIFATLGMVSILDIDATTNQAIAGLEPKVKVNEDYIYFALNNLKEQVNNIGRGAAQNNINLSILKRLEIYMPTQELQEQFSIFVRQCERSKFELEQALMELTATYKKIISENLR